MPSPRERSTIDDPQCKHSETVIIAHKQSPKLIEHTRKTEVNAVRVIVDTTSNRFSKKEYPFETYDFNGDNFKQAY